MLGWMTYASANLGSDLLDSPECLLFIRTLGFPDVRSRPYFIVVMTEILIPFQFTHF